MLRRGYPRHAIDETDILFVFCIMDPYIKVCRTAAGPAQLHGSTSGENCSTVGARTVLHNMLRRTADLDRELQVFGDVT